MARFILDPAGGRFTVQAFASGFLSGLGHSPTFAVRDFAGELCATPETFADAALRLTVKAESLALTNRVSAADRAEIEGRMLREVLETATHPEIVFQSTECAADKVTEGWYRLRLKGELTLHGVRGQQAVEVQVRLSADEARLSGQITLPMSAYRIKPVTAMGGMIKLKDELKLDFDLLAKTQPG